MKIAITGAGGNLGRAVVQGLAQKGHVLRLIDMRPIESLHETIVADVRDRVAVTNALEGCDAVIHAAALHGIHLGKWSNADFWDINVTGTFNVFEAAKAHRISKVVLCSTMGVYGAGLEMKEGAWGFAHESLPLRPTDVYGMSKVLAETVGRTYSQWGIDVVALRLGMFVPESTFERYGFRLLFGGVDDRDVAHAVDLALAFHPEGGFEAFNIMASVPFSDVAALHADLEGELERHYPGSIDLLKTRSIDAKSSVWWPVLWSTSLAQSRLGYQPKYGFGEFLAAFEKNDTDYYPQLGVSWWGV